jgi:fumarate hydratase class I
VVAQPFNSAMDSLTDALVELLRRASTDLPADVEEKLRDAHSSEQPGSNAAAALEAILRNIHLARESSTPICQDTGTPIFWVQHPATADTLALKRQIHEAVAEATRLSYLRPNAVDPITGENSGDNVGVCFPSMHFRESRAGHLQVELLLKGGGCENVSAQYALPCEEIGAGRDLAGVRRVVLDSVFRAQGKGCAPGILGVAIGGDRNTGYTVAKRQLFRHLDDANPISELAALEDRLSADCNALGIGPMGFGGRATVLGVKIGVCHRLPASYFVSVAYMCWACRRARLAWTESGAEYL